MNMPNVEKVRKAFTMEELTVIAIDPLDELDYYLKSKVFKLNKSFLFLFNARVLSKKINIDSYPTTIIYDNKTKGILLYERGASFNYDKTMIDFLKRYIPQK